MFQYVDVTIIGRVAEWFKAPVLKTGEWKRSVSSNLTSPAIYTLIRLVWFKSLGLGPRNRRFESYIRDQFYTLFVYRLGHRPFTAVRGVRFPYRVPSFSGGYGVVEAPVPVKDVVSGRYRVVTPRLLCEVRYDP